MLEPIIWILGTFIVGILLGPIPTGTGPISSQPKPGLRPSLITVGQMSSSAERAFCVYISAFGIAQSSE